MTTQPPGSTEGSLAGGQEALLARFRLCLEQKAAAEAQAAGGGAQAASAAAADSPDQSGASPSLKRAREEPAPESAPDFGWNPLDADEEVELEFDHLCNFYWGAKCASTPSRAWIGARGRPGIAWGCYMYEVKVLGENDLVRVGWSPSGSSRAVGSEPGSFGFGGTGKKSCTNKFADYGRAFGQGDVVGCLLNREQRFVAFTLNGEFLGRAHQIPRDLDGVPLYPAVCAREAFRVAGYFGHGHTRNGGLPFGHPGYWPLATATEEDRAPADDEPWSKRAKPAGGSEPTAEELEARKERAQRFQRPAAGAPVKAAGAAKEKDRFEEVVRKAASTSEKPIEGTCTDLEKPYLRITTLPRASDVRPLPVLKQAFALVQERWQQNRDWAWAGEMLRSIRQDLTVQMIRNSFTVEVYEVSARLALEAGDFKQFDQSSGPLEELHADADISAGANELEFLSYRLLYLMLQGGGLALSTFLARQALRLREASRSGHPDVAAAWRLRAALAAGRLGAAAAVDPPSAAGQRLSAMLTEAARLRRLAALCRSCKPGASRRLLSRLLPASPGGAACSAGARLPPAARMGAGADDAPAETTAAGWLDLPVVFSEGSQDMVDAAATVAEVEKLLSRFKSGAGMRLGQLSSSHVSGFMRGS